MQVFVDLSQEVAHVQVVEIDSRHAPVSHSRLPSSFFQSGREGTMRQGNDSSAGDAGASLPRVIADGDVVVATPVLAALFTRLRGIAPPSTGVYPSEDDAGLRPLLPIRAGWRSSAAVIALRDRQP
jgi:hypothetical protein